MTDECTTTLAKKEEAQGEVDVKHSHDMSEPEATRQEQSLSFQMLRQTVEDAYYLHNYSITTGKGIPEDVSAVIVKFKRVFDRGEETAITTEEEIEFSTAYRKLATLMLPVTVESLRDTEEVQFDPNRSLFQRFQLSKARQVIVLLPIFAIALIVLIIYSEIIQSIFLVGLQDIATKEAQVETLIAQLIEQQQQLDSLKQFEQKAKLQSKDRVSSLESSGFEAAEELGVTQSQLQTQVQEQQTQLFTLEDHSRELSADIDARLRSLKAIWDQIPIRPSFFNRDKQQEEWILDADQVVLIRMEFEILTEVLNRLLPILYGALGSAAYFLRMLIPHIRNRTFNKKHAGSISVRICLGMLSGVAIQWFLSNDQQQARIFERSLSTSALAFLAGYSVDLLFNIMDRFIAGLKSPTTPQHTSNEGC